MSQDYTFLYNVGSDDTADALLNTVRTRDNALRSNFAGDSFPTDPAPVDGQFCYRKDQRVFYYWDVGEGDWIALVGPGTETEPAVSPGGPYVNVKDFGAKGDGVTNDAVKIQSAINSIDSGSGGTVVFPKGIYILGAGLTLTNFNVRLLGAGVLSTRLRATHTAGAVVRMKRSRQTLEQLSIESSGSRLGAAAGSNYGVWGLTDDVSGYAIANSAFRSVRVVDQPNHGIRVVGNSQQSIFEDVQVQNNGGHGIFFESGESIGRSYPSQMGIISMRQVWALGNEGHGLAVGHPSDTHYPYRFQIDNLECVNNAQASGVRFSNHQAYIRGANHEIVLPGLGGNEVTGALYLQGENINVRNMRVIQCVQPAVTVGAAAAGLATNGVKFEGIRVVGAVTNHNPLITKGSGVSNVTASTPTMSSITLLI